jgi:hypothetical protein
MWHWGQAVVDTEDEASKQALAYQVKRPGKQALDTAEYQETSPTEDDKQGPSSEVSHRITIMI